MKKNNDDNNNNHWKTGLPNFVDIKTLLKAVLKIKHKLFIY